MSFGTRLMSGGSVHPGELMRLAIGLCIVAGIVIGCVAFSVQ